MISGCTPHLPQSSIVPHQRQYSSIVEIHQEPDPNMDSSPTHEILFSEYNVLDHDAAYRPATDTEDERVTQTNFPPNEACGFLTDSECASFQAAVESDSNDLAVEYLSVGEKSPSVTVNSSQRAPHGERLTGAVLFMATEKLRAAADEDFAFVHKIEHDIESFEWVVIYTIYHHSLGRMATGQLRTSVESEAGRLFSTSSIKLLYQRRCVALDDIGTSMSNLLRYITEEQQAPELASLLSQISWDLRYSPQEAQACKGTEGGG
ncbi:hypothetical protein BD309DRAFT_706180 [Dichomitus squalens]|nr:hypothetical protein BD309DRAFT_706180 [Dichomitus squalens]